VSYSPHLRTAVLLSGNGTGGAYHAGVLRALHEAGVKVDVMSGRGIGVVGAMFAAIDAAARTWEEGGVWRRRSPVRLYRWRTPLRAAGALVILAVAILAVPLLVLAIGLIAYPLAFLIQMINVDAGYRLASTYSAWVRDAFAPLAFPTTIPRLITFCLALAFCVLASAALGGGAAAQTIPATAHRNRGRWWARLIGSPWTAQPAESHFRNALWQLFRGSAAIPEPAPKELSRRYTELLFENLGQPGFRELIVATVDLETRGDLVFAALREERRASYFQRGHGDLIDLAGTGRHQIFEALGGAVRLPVLTEPQLVTFSPESYWRGETHRTCDRIGVVTRLLEELVAAGVEQVIIACPDGDRATPHRLSLPRGSLESRVGECLAASEASTVRDAVASYRKRFKGLFVIQPEHNPVGPFDVAGSFDHRSDRFQSVAELIDRGYEDAYRQFVEPVLGGNE
jgi:hypothetical protein